MEDDDTIIIFDTETTGLCKTEPAKLEDQPHIIEYAGVKLNYKTLEEIERLEFICKPPVELSDLIINITGIRNEAGVINPDTKEECAHIEGKKPFKAHIRDLVRFHLGNRFLCAHNLSFDINLMTYEMRRMGFMMKFPWAPNHICTVEKSMDVRGHRLKLSQLHEIATGEDFEGAHRAMVDVEALVRCFTWLRSEGKV